MCRISRREYEILSDGGEEQEPEDACRCSMEVQWPARLAGWAFVQWWQCSMICFAMQSPPRDRTTCTLGLMAQLNDMQAHRTGRLLHGRLPQYPSHPIPFASRRNRPDNGTLITVIYICWRRGQVESPVQCQHGHRFTYSLLLPLCANGHGQFATRLMTVQGDFEMVSRPTNSYLYSNLHEEDIEIDWAYPCLSRPVADVISGEALQRFGQEITGISPAVCSFSFSYSTAKFLIRTMRVLISSRGLCFTTFRFRDVLMVCGIRLFL